MHDIVGTGASDLTKTAHAPELVGDVDDAATARRFGAGDFLPVADYCLDAQFRITVVGNAINKIAQDGDTLHCVRADAVGAEPQDGDLVIIDCADGDDCRLLIRRLRRIGDLCEFRHESNDPAFQDAPLVRDMQQDDGSVRIMGKVLFACRRLGA